ncbi:hypothetical protein D8674_039096 [Pyrus ussuriensis x Pyrus communis]|uniref:Uncharacterized protein n=1 Tax=Pyrus ussuriensis x Pyrus communis TaxID=2448454 RepID=A0A5N5FNP4_9ROSA|nr:hypothetical protein D8674_039096 [Pyrus ussuriensis x Pyrus communis]
MVMASNSNKYAVVERAKYEELRLEDSAWWSVEISNVSTNYDARDNGISQALFEGETFFEAACRKDNGDVEDMFVNDVGMHVAFLDSNSARLDFSDGVRNVKHGQWHGGVDVSKKNLKHVNQNDRGNEDDGVLESCCGKVN